VAIQHRAEQRGSAPRDTDDEDWSEVDWELRSQVAGVAMPVAVNLRPVGVGLRG
jgi:hypothetical protein